MSLVHNERIKLTTAAIDRLSTAMFVVGFFGPLVTLFTSQDAFNHLDLWKMLVFFHVFDYIFFCIAFRCTAYAARAVIMNGILWLYACGWLVIGLGYGLALMAISLKYDRDPSDHVS